MDEGTQQNAALVEEVAAASASMEDQARQLQQLTNKFTVDGYQSVSAEPSTGISSLRTMAASIEPSTPAAPAAPVTHRPKPSLPPQPIVSLNESDDEWEEF
jgi:methyl-accepting chemotaxis protein